jgi:hypothetical protein
MNSWAGGLYSQNYMISLKTIYSTGIIILCDNASDAWPLQRDDITATIIAFDLPTANVKT